MFSLTLDKYLIGGELNRYSLANFYDNFNIRFKPIYLGIETNIVAFDDRPSDFESFWSERIHLVSGNPDNGSNPKIFFPDMHDITATLYLGKIIFEKNKQGILAPKFIPTTITDSSFEGLNTFWLNEINKKALPTTKPIVWTKFSTAPLPSPTISKDGYKYLKIHYFRHKDNIVLTKDQIISYFTELHQKNTTFIQNYIDSINTNRGIKAYHLNDRIYDEMLKNGIIDKSMIKRYTDTYKVVRNNALDLIALDYLSTLKESNRKMLFKIVLYDELFYAYFALSLKNFIVNFSASLSDGNNLLFNAGAYKRYNHLLLKKYQYSTTNRDITKIIFNNAIEERDNKGNPIILGKLFFGNNGGLMYMNNKKAKSIFFSPNYNMLQKQMQDAFGFFYDIMDYRYDISKITTFTPSPLGKYYFELSDNKGVYIEFFDRIYPNITNPPKGWSKEMMRKLELRLE